MILLIVQLYVEQLVKRLQPVLINQHVVAFISNNHLIKKSTDKQKTKTKTAFFHFMIVLFMINF
jgi:hypothetical protein